MNKMSAMTFDTLDAASVPLALAVLAIHGTVSHLRKCMTLFYVLSLRFV